MSHRRERVAGFWLDLESRRVRELAKAETEREGILKGLAFIENRARRPETAKFWRSQVAAELDRLSEKCRSNSQ